MVAILWQDAGGNSFGGRAGHGSGLTSAGNLPDRSGHSPEWMAPAPTKPGLRAVPLRSTPDALVRAGWLLLVVGLFCPWLEDDPGCSGSHHHMLGWILDHMGYGFGYWRYSRRVIVGIEWWWSLPLAYGLALPALWCSRYRAHMGARIVIGWAWIAGILGVLWWAPSTMPLDWQNVLSTWRCCPDRSFFWALQPRQAGIGFYVTAVGALLVGVCPMIELQRLRGILRRWRARPGRLQARRAIDRHALLRLGWSLRRLVCEARELRAILSPLRPLDAEVLRRLADLVGHLRALDDQARAELRDHGQCADALIEALAPAELRRESCVDEALRVDEALTRLEAVALQADGVAPYR